MKEASNRDAKAVAQLLRAAREFRYPRIALLLVHRLSVCTVGYKVDLRLNEEAKAKDLKHYDADVLGTCF